MDKTPNRRQSLFTIDHLQLPALRLMEKHGRNRNVQDERLYELTRRPYRPHVLSLITRSQVHLAAIDFINHTVHREISLLNLQCVPVHSEQRLIQLREQVLLFFFFFALDLPSNTAAPTPWPKTPRRAPRATPSRISSPRRHPWTHPKALYPDRPPRARARVTGRRIGADRADDFPAYFLVERSIAPHRAVVVASTISRGGTVTDCPHAIVERARVRRASRCAAPRGHCRCILQKQLADATPGRKISIDEIELQGLGYSCLSSSRTS